MDKINGSTVMHLACAYLSDIVIISTLLDGGADPNSVNNDNKLPLNYLRERLEKDPENYDLVEIDIKLV
jgi:ankyrin repeat protein